MATVAAGVVAGLIGSQFSVGIGGAAILGLSQAVLIGAGAYFDATVLGPAIFPPKDQHGPRVGDVQIGARTFGAPIAFAHGKNYRVACHLIWQGPRREISSTISGGGKGGTSGNFIQYRQVRDAAYLVQDTEGRPVSRALSVLFNSKTVFTRGSDVSVTDAASSPNKITLSSSIIITSQVVDPGGAVQEYGYISGRVFAPAAGGLDMSGFVKGQYLNLFGSTSVAGWVGTWLVLEVGDDFVDIQMSSPVQWIGTLTRPATNDTNSTGDVILLFQPELGFSERQFSNLEIFNGEPDQIESEIMVAVEGSGNVPAYRGHAILVFKDLDTHDYGNAAPNCEAIVESDPAPYNVSEAIDRVLSRCKLPRAEYDESAVGDRIQGQVLSGPTTTISALGDLMLTYDVLARDEDTVWTFYDREDAPSVTVTDGDLGAWSAGGTGPNPQRVVDPVPPQLRATAVQLTYIDPNKDFQRGGVVQRVQSATTNNPTPVDLSLVMSRTKARKTAARLLHQSITHSREVEFGLPPSYIVDAKESTLFEYDAQGSPWCVLSNTVERGADYSIRVKGVREDQHLAESRFQAES